MNEIIKQVEVLSKEEPKTLIQRYLKLGEEVGELAQEIGIRDNVSGFSYKEVGKDGIKGECADVIITTLAIFFFSDGTIEELKELIVKKNIKWQSKMVKK